MTPNQLNFFYFPAWQRAVKANGWRSEHKRLQGNLEFHTQPGRTVMIATQALAAAEHRGLKLDDIRYAVHMVASGRAHAWRLAYQSARKVSGGGTRWSRGEVSLALFEENFNQSPLGACKSSKVISDNLEIDFIVCIFNLLAEPDFLGSDRAAGMTDWLNPEQMIRRRLVGYLRATAPEGVICHLAAERFGTKNWEQLSSPQLEEIASRLSRWRKHNQISGRRLSARRVEEPGTGVPAGIAAQDNAALQFDGDGNPQWT